MANLKDCKFDKYVVLKTEDCDRYLTRRLKNCLDAITFAICRGRTEEGKNTDNKYLVINTDEPYVDEIVDVLKKHGHWG